MAKARDVPSFTATDQGQDLEEATVHQVQQSHDGIGPVNRGRRCLRCPAVPRAAPHRAAGHRQSVHTYTNTRCLGYALGLLSWRTWCNGKNGGLLQAARSS